MAGKTSLFKICVYDRGRNKRNVKFRIKREEYFMELLGIVLIIVYAIIGGLSTAVLTISLPGIIIWKFYRKVKYHKALTA